VEAAFGVGDRDLGHVEQRPLRLHALKGDRKGRWAVSVSGNWRLVFEFEGPNVTNVDLVDYH
jgi:proteic killer suppression protein